MKILHVSFENLNSLRGKHRIDLASGPLSQAGIFAITGPTGAGKSTILDAITLALYGRAARYGTTPSPEHMMSRHTGECQAEVVFAVNRGEFRASWHLKRARGKVEGNLQPAQRRVFDAQGVTLAQKTGDADRLIEEVTGLDYDRFLRSVLLAQGEFARFLKANADERAGLLEQLTGTDIYSRLSLLAHTEAGRREMVSAQEERAHAAIILLSGEERAGKAGEITHLGDELATGTRAHDALAERINLGRQLQAKLEESHSLLERQKELAVRRERATPDFARLDRHDQTQPFCADLARLDASAARAAQEEGTWSEARVASQAAAGSLAAARAAVRLLADADVAAHERELTRLKWEEKNAAAQLETVNQWLEQRPGERALEAKLPAISEKLAFLAEARRRQEDLRERGETLLAREGSARGQLSETRITLAHISGELGKRLTASENIAGELSALLDGRQSADFQSELSRRHGRKELLTRLDALLQKSIQADGKEKSLAATEEALLRELSGHREQADQARRTASLLATLVETLQDHLASAQLVASFEEHRARLQPGETCPLCGSVEHPFAGAAAGLSSLDTIGGKLARSKTELKAAEAELREKEETLTRVTEQHKTTAEQRAAVQSEHGLAQREFAEHAGQHGITLDGSLTLQAEIAATAGTITRAEGQIATLQRLGTRHDEATRAYQDLRVEAGKLEEAARAAESALALAVQELSSHAAEASAHAVELDGLTAETARLLEPFAQAVPLAGDEPTLRNALEARCEEYQRQLASARDGESTLQTLRHGINLAETEWQHARRRAEEFPPQTSEQFPDTARAAELAREWSTLPVALERVNALALAETTRRATESARRASSQEARRLVDAEAAALGAKLGAVPGLFAGLDDLRSARLSDQDAARIEAARCSLAGEESELVGQRKQLEQNTADLRARQAPEGEALEAIEAERGERKDRNDELAARRVRAEEELRRDDVNRDAQAQRAAVIEQALVQLRYWRQLRELIGSYDGRKFRRFAQGLSLDLLARHANRHLARLTDRYRLHRVEGEELNLEIVDQYQAGSRRPMASLSGGESFLTSLALALGLSDLAGRNVRIDSLFVDEGFGSLDADTLDIAVAALESLRASNKTIGIISHVEMLKERISAQIRLEKQPGGTSTITITG